MKTVKTCDGTELAVKDWGQGRPVVMLHGWPLSADTFDGLSMLLAEQGFRAISYDRRGFGRSGQPWTGYDYDTLADDLATVLEALQLERVTLLGFSMGGGEVVRYLSRHGSQRVAQVVLMASVVPCMAQTLGNPDGVEAEVFASMIEDLRDDRARFYEGFFKDFFGQGLLSKPVSQGVLDWSVRQAMQAGLKPAIACVEAFSRTDFRPDLVAVTVPTLIIHGTDDKIVPIATGGTRRGGPPGSRPAAGDSGRPAWPAGHACRRGQRAGARLRARGGRMTAADGLPASG